MKNFDIRERHKRIIELDHKTEHGKYFTPSNKREYIDANSINLALEENIYRIFSIDKFKKTLESKKLCLVRPHKWQDPFENFLLNSVGKLDDGTEVSFETIRNNYFGQCWTLKKECDGLWRNYKGSEPSAIKVKSSVEKLMNQFYNIDNKFHMLSYFIGKVDYVTDTEIENYFKNEIDIINFQSGVEFAQTLLIKRLSFSYEEEVRIIYSKSSQDKHDSDLYFVDIDPNTLFEEIEIDPWLTKTEFEKLKQELIDLGYKGNITRSSLYDRPFFVTKIKR
jgi:hypothetical protein